MVKECSVSRGWASLVYPLRNFITQNNNLKKINPGDAVITVAEH